MHEKQNKRETLLSDSIVGGVNDIFVPYEVTAHIGWIFVTGINTAHAMKSNLTQFP